LSTQFCNCLLNVNLELQIMKRKHEQDQLDDVKDSKDETQQLQKKQKLEITRVIKVQRKNGVIVEPFDIYIGRAWNMGGWNLKASKWNNPFKVKKLGMEKCLKQYREHVLKRKDLIQDLDELDGKVLGCWCKKKPSDPCHGDVLIELLELKKQGKLI
jgi:hypothetical protein